MPDDYQRQTAEQLQRVYEHIHGYEPSTPGLLSKWFGSSSKKQSAPKGLTGLAADAPVDSVVVAVADWGGRSRSSALQLCNSSTLTASVDHNAGMRFGVAQLPTNLKVAGGRLELPVTDGSLGVFPTASAAVHFAQNDWSTCTYAYPGPPFPETNALLAIGALSDRPNCAVFESDGLLAFFEGQARRMPLYGLLLRSASPVIYGTQTVNGVVPRAILYFYPPGTQAAASPAPVR